MKIKIYTVGREKLIGMYNVRSSYDDAFYHCNMPALSEKRCREILDIVSPTYKIGSATLVFENAETGYTGIQLLHRNGTILNF